MEGVTAGAQQAGENTAGQSRLHALLEPDVRLDLHFKNALEER
jgi:hypothetical protein